MYWGDFVNQLYNFDSIQRFFGLSSDTKPTGCTNGSIFIEIDTTNKYIYNAASAQWTLIPSGGGGGGGTIVVDSELSMLSENPVQNKVITEVLTPISESDYNALQTYANTLYFVYEDDV